MSGTEKSKPTVVSIYVQLIKNVEKVYEATGELRFNLCLVNKERKIADKLPEGYLFQSMSS